jgi:hypothetical protein
MNGVNLTSNGGKLNPYRGQNDPNDRGQNDPLPLKVLPLETTIKKIPVAIKKEPFVTKDGKYDWLREKTGISLDEIPE